MARRESPQGLHPCTRVPFLCFAKEKEPKERRPRCLRPWLRQGCPALLRTQGPRKTRCVRGAHSAQTVARVSSQGVPAARGPGFLRCSAWHRGNSKQPNSQQPNTEQPGLQPTRRFPAVGCSAVWAAAPMRCREAQLGWAACASTRSLQTRPDCLSGVNKLNAASFGPAQPSEHRRGLLGEAKGLRIGAVFFAYFLARARKSVACRGEIPAGCVDLNLPAKER